MHTIGRFESAGRSLNGDLTITLVIDDEEIEAIEKLKGCDLVIDITRYSPKRSLNANKYFWVLCDQIAKTLGSDKDTIYLLQLKKYGVFVDIEIIESALDELKNKFRYVEVFDDGYSEFLKIDAGYDCDNRITARCYFGSSQYSKKEMSYLINGTVNDAKDLGIETWTEEEIHRIIEMWERNK